MSCRKNDNSSCSVVIITQNGTPCSTWGIIINGTTYPSLNIPGEFQNEGESVCANYELYDDMRLCVCCGGKWANIKSMKKTVP